MPQNDGFTLAEVLITLVIIGVIAAITVPALVNKNNKQIYVSQLKATYSILAQATNKAIAEEGNPSGWTDTNEHMYQAYKKHLSIAKDCGAESGCFAQTKDKGFKTIKGSNSSDYQIDSTEKGYYKLILTNGVQVAFLSANSTCSREYGGISGVCGQIWADINGEKKPNTGGRDFFMFILTKNGLYPRGCANSDETCSKDKRKDSGCACKVIKENAMNY